jgi:hypothetical protein
MAVIPFTKANCASLKRPTEKPTVKRFNLFYLLSKKLIKDKTIHNIGKIIFQEK